MHWDAVRWAELSGLVTAIVSMSTVLKPFKIDKVLETINRATTPTAE